MIQGKYIKETDYTYIERISYFIQKEEQYRKANVHWFPKQTTFAFLYCPVE